MLEVMTLDQLAAREDLVDALELDEPEGRGKVAHAGLVGHDGADDDRAALVGAPAAVVAQRRGNIGVIRHHHAALAAAQRRRLREVEHRAIAETADACAPTSAARSSSAPSCPTRPA
jgi:hypothetical protein